MRCHGQGRHRRLQPRVRSLLGAAGLVLWAGTAAAHEFWIALEDYTPASSVRIRGTLNVGEAMTGQELPYLTRSFVDFRVWGPWDTAPVAGREGDRPALVAPTLGAGLNAVTYHAAPASLAYDAPGQFADYLDYEGLDGVLAAHRARGLDETGFTEVYSRAAKALIQVGPVRGDESDGPTNLPLELIALANPYAPGLATLPVRLVWLGTPQPDLQIATFRRAPDGTVSRTLLRTDLAGEVAIPLDGPGAYLLNAVRIEPVEGHGDVAWHSHWASLTFAIE